MSNIGIVLKRLKVFNKVSDEYSNKLPEYTANSKDAIVSQYNYLVKDIGMTKTQASKALGKLHSIHPSTIRKWNKNPKYNRGLIYYLKASDYLVSEDINHLSVTKVEPAYASVPKSVETSTAMDKLVDALLKIKSITLTLKFNKT